MGQKLSDLTTQKVIVGILAILLIIPVFNIYSGLYGTYSGLSQGGLQMLHNLYLNVSNPNLSDARGTRLGHKDPSSADGNRVEKAAMQCI